MVFLTNMNSTGSRYGYIYILYAYNIYIIYIYIRYIVILIYNMIYICIYYKGNNGHSNKKVNYKQSF